MNKKVYFIKEITDKLDKDYVKFEINPERRNPDIDSNNIIQINFFKDPNYLMNELCNFLIRKKPNISNIETNKEKFEIIITEKSCNESDEYNQLYIQYSIRLYRNINNYYYFLKINYINGNVNLYYSLLELLKEHIEFLSKKKNIIKIIYKNDEKNENDDKEEINIFGEEFVLNNKNRCKIIYNNKEYELTSKFKIKQNESLKIHLKILSYLTNMNEMFQDCTNLFSLPDINLIDTSKVTDMNNLFNYCESLEYLPGISEWNTHNVSDMSFLFYNCSSIQSLPDISKWDTSNVIDMNSLFYNCSYLYSLPDISKWNTSNVTNM